MAKIELPRIQLVVVNEHTLGYIRPESPHSLIILHTSILKGSYWNQNAGPVLLSSMDNVRLASRKDFEEYRVLFTDRGYGNKDIYEYDK